MPSPTSETRTLDDLAALVVDAGLAGVEELTGAELLVGWESAVVRTADGWIYRFARQPEPAFRRELEVLALVDGRLGVSTPRVERVSHPHLLMAYRTIIGSPLDLDAVRRRSPAARAELAHSLARVLVAMHSLAGSARDRIAIPIHDPNPMVEQVRAARSPLSHEDRAVIDDLLADWERRALSRRCPDPVLLHGDFHPGNMVFADPSGPITGIWDFSCVELGDPAADLRYLSGDSPALAHEVGRAYAALTGRVLDVVGARMMLLLEDITDAIAEDRPYDQLLRDWQRSGGVD